jgi:hypothetical protein
VQGQKKPWWPGVVPPTCITVRSTPKPLETLAPFLRVTDSVPAKVSEPWIPAFTKARLVRSRVEL